MSTTTPPQSQPLAPVYQWIAEIPSPNADLKYAPHRYEIVTTHDPEISISRRVNFFSEDGGGSAYDFYCTLSLAHLYASAVLGDEVARLRIWIMEHPKQYWEDDDNSVAADDLRAARAEVQARLAALSPSSPSAI